MKRLFRCDGCGWRGWLLPIEQFSTQTDMDTALDLTALDGGPPSAERRRAFSPRDLE